jgi:hypothetical protein
MEKLRIQVSNISDKTPMDGVQIYIGRKNARKGFDRSPLANPFPLSKYGRKESIAKYRIWLWGKIQADDKSVKDELDRIWRACYETGVNLRCYCHPKPCHGDIIVRCLAYLDANNPNT